MSRADCGGGAGHAASSMGRRRFLGLMGLGLTAALGGCTSPRRPSSNPADQPATTPTAPPTTAAPPDVVHGPIPPPAPGKPQLISKSRSPTSQIALTIDDGTCGPCSQAYVDFVQRTGIHITFSPNGTNHEIWDPLAASLVPLIDTGQVQIGNHTYTHANLLKASDAKIREELERNEEWIQAKFNITSRPWFRPPFGFRNGHTDGVAAQLGYTNIFMWNGSFGDAVVLTPEVLLAQAERYLKPGTIMLGHANHPTVIDLLPQIYDLISERGLQPATLDEMFGTSRDEGRAQAPVVFRP
ncbi:MAG: polysaccharide deacetylase family protein [Acidimicrobiales bacterium]